MLTRRDLFKAALCGGVLSALSGCARPSAESQPRSADPLAYGPVIFLDPQEGSDAADGVSWGTAVLTMREALTRVQRGSTIYVCGKFREDGLVTPQGATDVRVVGIAPHPRSGSTGRTNGPKGGAANWVPNDDESTAPLLTVTQQGWSFERLMFHNPRKAPALHFLRNKAGEETPTGFAGDHARVVTCVFDGPGYGIVAEGGVNHVLVKRNLFFRYNEPGNAAIQGRIGEGVGAPLQWEMLGNRFFGNVADVVFPYLADAVVMGNVFAPGPRVGVALDLRHGERNVIAHNAMGCAFKDATARFVPGQFEQWGPNEFTDGTFHGLPS